jgi:type I restriction enzyme S subunit
MGVSAGYKQTDVGVIPDEWEPTATADIVDPHAPICYGVVQVGQDTNDGVPIVAIKYVKEIASAPLHRTAVALEEPYARSRITGGDVLISIKGTIGRVGVVPAGFEGNISRELARLRPRDGYSAGYIAQQLEADATQTRISRAVVGTTRFEFSISTLRKFEIPVPKSLTEQHAIATALSDVDALLGGLDRLIAKKRDLKQAAMQQLLTGRTRLPGFHGEWEVKRLRDVAHIKTGSRNNEDKIEDGEYPFYVRSENVERINSYSHDCEAILVPGEGRIGDIFHYINGRFDVHQRVYAITQFRPHMSARFVHFYMAMRFGAWAMQNTVKATVDSLRLPTFQMFEMRVPPTKEEQTTIAAVLSDMDAELAALAARRNKTGDLKQAIMQELLTGKTRLVPAGAAHA